MTREGFLAIKGAVKISRQRIRSAALALALAAGGLASASAQVALSFTSVGANSYLDSNNRMIGWEFTVDQTLEVGQLGWFDLNGDGLAVAHQIGIWDTSDQSLVTSVTIGAGTGATFSDGFRYVILESPAFLLPGLTYRIAGFDQGTGGDAHVWDVFHSGFADYQVNGFAVDANINLTTGDALGAVAGSFGYPSGPIGDARAVLMGPNLVFTAVPEPATTALLMTLCAGAAVALVRFRRHRLAPPTNG